MVPTMSRLLTARLFVIALIHGSALTCLMEDAAAGRQARAPKGNPVQILRSRRNAVFSFLNRRSQHQPAYTTFENENKEIRHVFHGGGGPVDLSFDLRLLVPPGDEGGRSVNASILAFEVSNNTNPGSMELSYEPSQKPWDYAPGRIQLYPNVKVIRSNPSGPSAGGEAEPPPFIAVEPINVNRISLADPRLGTELRVATIRALNEPQYREKRQIPGLGGVSLTVWDPGMLRGDSSPARSGQVNVELEVTRETGLRGLVRRLQRRADSSELTGYARGLLEKLGPAERVRTNKRGTMRVRTYEWTFPHDEPGPEEMPFTIDVPNFDWPMPNTRSAPAATSASARMSPESPTVEAEPPGQSADTRYQYRLRR